MEKDKKAELSKLGSVIRQNVEQKIKMSVPTASTSSAGSVKSSGKKEEAGGDDFWNLGQPKPRKYKKPDFSDTPIEMTNVNDTVEVSYDVPEPEKIADGARMSKEVIKKDIYSKLKYRPADNTEIFDDIFDSLAPKTDKTAKPSSDKSGDTSDISSTKVKIDNGRQTVVHDVPRFQTGSYKRQGGFSQQQKNKKDISEKKKKRTSSDVIISKYKPNGLLISEVEVHNWVSDIDFYERFMENAENSHTAQPTVPYTSNYPSVKYFSYVPQYSHMSRAQIDYYRWIRENIRHGKYPDCDSSYIQLYIYEILNLPELIEPEYGAAQLAGIWLAYRKTEPRLDGYLCEWLPDYCMIHSCKLPAAIKEILPAIVPKAQFKEFFFDINPENATDEDYIILAKTLIETSSDYDYRRSRYYNDNRAAYEKHITRATAEVIKKSLSAGGKGVLSLEKTYKMARDCYCGAIVSTDVKRRMNIEFRSFTRSADTRPTVTALVKYSENKLRAVLGIKAKLGVEQLSAEGTEIIDEYFAPLLPVKAVKSKEDAFMPEDYLKNYESKDSGFDFSTAIEIERQSWQNTTILTGGEFDAAKLVTETEAETESAASSTAADEEQNDINSALEFEHESETEVSEQIDADEETAETSSDELLIRGALNQALDGCFHDFCREHQIYDGVLADRINTLFLDIIGDVVLEESGGSYVIIEDYREDIEQWTNGR